MYCCQYRHRQYGRLLLTPSPALATAESLTADSAAGGGDSGLLSRARADVSNFNLVLDMSLSENSDNDTDANNSILTCF